MPKRKRNTMPTLRMSESQACEVLKALQFALDAGYGDEGDEQAEPVHRAVRRLWNELQCRADQRVITTTDAWGQTRVIGGHTEKLLPIRDGEVK